MTEPDEAPSSSPRNPTEIWSAVNYIRHETTYALARRKRIGDTSEADQPVGVTQLKPTGGQKDDKSLFITLRAQTRSEEGHSVIYEKAALISLEEPMDLSELELKTFAAEYILPFLMPYVEIGFERLCTEIEISADFPMFVIAGRIIEASVGPDDEGEEFAAADDSSAGNPEEPEPRHRK